MKYELGALYYKLASYEMAKRYFKEALESPDIDPITRERIATYMPDVEKQLTPSRFTGFAQVGIRSQSNANYAPTAGLVSLGGQQYALLPGAQKRSDFNAFQLVGLSHDYDFGDQRATTFETRFVGYATQQFRFADLNVGLVDISMGPRFAIAPELYPGLTIKPYIVGGKAWVGGASYLTSGGAGVSMQVPVNDRFMLGPEFEWRRSTFDNNSPVALSGFDSGDWYTGGLSASYRIAQQIKLDGRGMYREGRASLVWQNFHQWVVEAAVTFEFAPPFEWISRNWSVAPFARWISTDFAAPNPFIDPFTARRDEQWSVGAMWNAPITRELGFMATIQYDHIDSTLVNYRQNNFSVMVGPTARF